MNTARGVGLALASMLFAAASAASAANVFGAGPYILPEGVSGGASGLFVSDLSTDSVYQLASTGGAPVSTVPVGFRPAGVVTLSGYYDAGGTVLVYGSNPSEFQGLVAPLQSDPTPTQVDSGSILLQAAVAPTAFGAIAAGQVVFSTPYDPGSLDLLSADAAGATKFNLSDGAFATSGVAFAPATFGRYAGDIFVSDEANGAIDVVDANGVATPFARIPLPAQSNTGLRQIAFAPAGFETYGGDLFVSVAGRNGGGGIYGAIDIVNAAGQIVGHYQQGTGLGPLDPRGLDFVDGATLVFANADPELIVATPADFVPGPAGVPEPAAWSLMLIGVGALGAARRAKRVRSPLAA